MIKSRRIRWEEPVASIERTEVNKEDEMGGACSMNGGEECV
jgi:hypothetical protein